MNKQISAVGLMLATLLSINVSAKDLSGAQLYADNCASCHGATGEGGIGLILNRPILATQLSDDFITTFIKLGSSGRVMPSFKNKLSNSQIKAVVEHMRSWQKDPNQRIVYDKTFTANGDYKKGANFYQKHCADCHGKDLEGDTTGMGVALSRKRERKIGAPSLGSVGYFLASNDAMLINIIKNGRGKMPAFKSSADVRNVVSFIRKRSAILSAQKLARNNQQTPPISLAYQSPYDFETTKENIKAAIKASNFRLYAPRLLEEGLGLPVKKLDISKRVYRFCNFQMLAEFLKIEPRLGIFLPCNITVTETDGKVFVIVPNLSRLILMFNNDALAKKSEQVISILEDLIEEALL